MHYTSTRLTHHSSFSFLRCDELANVFTYKIMLLLTALFESNAVMRISNKASLLHTLCSQIKTVSSVPKKPLLYGLDGGAFLHGIPWMKGPHGFTSFGSMYNTSTAGIQEHARTTGTHIEPDFHFTPDMTISLRKSSC